MLPIAFQPLMRKAARGLRKTALEAAGPNPQRQGGGPEGATRPQTIRPKRSPRSWRAFSISSFFPAMNGRAILRRLLCRARGLFSLGDNRLRGATVLAVRVLFFGVFAHVTSDLH